MPALYYHPKATGLPGSKLTFSISGTTTLQNVYTDDTLLVPHSNPVVADANGVFAPIYMDPKLPDYRVKYTTSADVLIYQVDDYPSNQNTQQSMRLESTNPNLVLYDTDGTSNARKYRIIASGDSFEIQALNEAETVPLTLFKFQGGFVYAGGAGDPSASSEVAVTTYGSFTGTLTGYAAGPTGTVYYRKINNVVTLWINSAINGTSNATTMTMTGMPVAIRPANARTLLTDVVDNSNELLGLASIAASGTISFFLHSTSTVANRVAVAVNAFTNSGTKGLNEGWTLTYTTS